MMHGCSERKMIPQSASDKNCDKTLQNAALVPHRARPRIGKPGLAQTPAQVVQDIVRHVDHERPHLHGGSSKDCAGHKAVRPPSTNKQVPVTYEASSDARNSTHAATSWGVPGRLSMVRAPASARYSSRVLPAAAMRPS